jgi:hypothetical protein
MTLNLFFKYIPVHIGKKIEIVIKEEAQCTYGRNNEGCCCQLRYSGKAFRVCVCSLSFPNAKRMHPIVLHPVIYYIFPDYLIKDTTFVRTVLFDGSHPDVSRNFQNRVVSVKHNLQYFSTDNAHPKLFRHFF